MAKQYDVIIIGGGPAGLFAALELVKVSGMRVLLLEKGRDIDSRQCPARDRSGACATCDPCNLVCGLGGAGAFSDGKLTLSADVGGRLAEYVGDDGIAGLLNYVDDTYRRYGAPDMLYGVADDVARLCRQAEQAGLQLKQMPVRHMGTDNCRLVLKSIRDYLDQHIDIKLCDAASRIVIDDGRVVGVVTDDGDSLSCKYMILAPGREGADWLYHEAQRLNLTMHNNPVDVGVRVEVEKTVMADFCDILYEGKLEFLSPVFADRVRTFCMCPEGEVIMESTGGADPVTTVNGHSYAARKTDNTNFAVLTSTNFTEPFREPIAYGKYLARLANILSGGVLVQRFGDLLKGRRSTKARIAKGKVRPTLASATPGDVSFVLSYRHLSGIIDMLKAMDRLVPGVASDDTLLYGVEVKFYSARLQLSPDLESEISNLFAAGDGAGISRGLIQASASGVVAARGILGRIDS